MSTSAEITKTQLRIYNTIRNLTLLPKVNVIKTSIDLDSFEIVHSLEFVPDFQFKWCYLNHHYRVHILVADREFHKRNTGYCVCTVGSGLTAMAFGSLYGFLHKHRANNKESAYSTNSIV